MKTSRALHRVSLVRALSKLGYCSRSEAHHRIASGIVSVNDIKETNPHRWIDLSKDVISVHGKRISRAAFRYVLFHKPIGVVTTRSDERGNKTVYQILPEDLRFLNPVGRLDKDTSGLLLLTNNNNLADTLANPSSHVEKTYRALLDKPMSSDALRELETGVEISVDGRIYRTRGARIQRVSQNIVELSITEGKNRQVRKMFASLAYDVRELARIAFGPLKLGNLKSGQHRDLTKEESASLSGIV